MPHSSEYSCASVYSYDEQSPRPHSPRSARRRLIVEDDMSPLQSPETIKHRMSVASGPKVRRYEDVSWDDDSWSRTSTMTGLSTKVKDVVKTKCGMRDKEASNADALNCQLSTLTSSATATSSFTSTSDGSSAQLQTVTSRHFFDSASGVSISLSSTSNSSIDSANNIETPRKVPMLLDAFDQTPSVPERKYGGQQWPHFLSGADSKHADHRTTPKAAGRNYRPTISEPFSFAVLSTPISTDAQNMQLPCSGRPLVASASPNFSLISLADAQQRERARSQTPHEQPKGEGGPRVRAVAERMPIPVPASPQSNRLKNKKSGIMKFLNKTPRSKRSQDRKESSSPETAYRTMEPSQVYPENLQKHQHELVTAVGDENKAPAPQPMLQLRPVSMNISRHIPNQYFALASPKASPSLATLSESDQTDAVDNQPRRTNQAETRLANVQKAHRLQVYELEAQVRELKLSLEAAASGTTAGCTVCENCGHERGSKPASGIMNRARVKTAGPRGVFGSGSLYEAM